MPAAAATPAAPPARRTAERLRLSLLWLTGATSALVFIEPSPYEVVSVLALFVFLATGLSFRPALLPVAMLLALTNVGYTVSAYAIYGEPRVLTWVLTSWYMAVTALFFAAALGANTEARLDALMRGCIIAGVIAAVAGIAGYFRLVPGGNDLLLLYDRARGTFKDPNVFGAFLVLPALLALQQVLIGKLRRAAGNFLLLGLFAAALLLSFSRGAWGQMVFAGAVVLLLTFVTSPSPHQRLRIVLFTGGGVVALALLIAALLSLDIVANLLKERLSLGQSYDLGETGRFGRHLLGSLLALDVPLGIGPLQFSKYFPEDPHNSYLSAFMAGGWLAGVAFATMVLLTLVYGLRAVFTPTPWQSTAIVIYAAYLGTMAESVIIDSDHWRHAFLQLGVLWGLIAATQAYVRQPQSRAGVRFAPSAALAR